MIQITEQEWSTFSGRWSTVTGTVIEDKTCVEQVTHVVTKFLQLGVASISIYQTNKRGMEFYLYVDRPDKSRVRIKIREVKAREASPISVG